MDSLKDSLPARFVNHCVLALRYDPRASIEVAEYAHTPNFSEKVGDFVSWPTYEAPRHIWSLISNPRAITVFFTLSALYGNTLLFYPTKTMEITSRVFNKAREMVPQLKFPAYCVASSQIIGIGTRSYGRFGNATLMHAFDKDRYPEPAK